MAHFAAVALVNLFGFHLWSLISVISHYSYISVLTMLLHFRAAFECLWTDLRGLSPDVIVSQEGRRRKITTVIWFKATLALAVFIPNIGIVIEIIGAFAAVFIFIFPGM
jgi:sodium-coupled neutral amino acid transporter 7/8